MLQSITVVIHNGAVGLFTKLYIYLRYYITYIVTNINETTYQHIN